MGFKNGGAQGKLLSENPEISINSKKNCQFPEKKRNLGG